MKKHILVHILMFPPDQLSTAYLYGDLVQEFLKNGYKVTVITTTPHYNYSSKFTGDKQFNFLWKKTNYFGADVFHFPHTSSKNIFLRSLNILLFHFAFIFKAASIKKVDIFLTPSPPITAGLLSGIVAKIKGSKSLYNVQEIYPDVLINHLNLKYAPLIWVLKKVEKFTYSFNDRVIVIDETFRKKIENRLSNNKIMVIPNFVDTSLYKPYLDKIRDEYSFEGKFLVGYVGNLGSVQDWDCVLLAAKQLEENDKIHFLLVGGGSEYTKLSNLSKVRKNITVMPYQHRNSIPELNQRIDLHFISMSASSDYDGLPSKILTILSSGKPILAATEKDTPLAIFLKGVGFSTIVERGNSDLFAKAILFLSSEIVSQSDSQQAREKIIENYSKETICGKYVGLIDSLVTEK